MKLILKDQTNITISNFTEYSNITKIPNQLEGIMITIVNPEDETTIAGLQEVLTEDNLSEFVIERTDGIRNTIDGTKYQLYDIRKIINDIVYSIEIVLKRKAEE